MYRFTETPNITVTRSLDNLLVYQDIEKKSNAPVKVLTETNRFLSLQEEQFPSYSTFSGFSSFTSLSVESDLQTFTRTPSYILEENLKDEAYTSAKPDSLFMRDYNYLIEQKNSYFNDPYTQANKVVASWLTKLTLGLAVTADIAITFAKEIQTNNLIERSETCLEAFASEAKSTNWMPELFYSAQYLYTTDSKKKTNYYKLFTFIKARPSNEYFMFCR